MPAPTTARSHRHAWQRIIVMGAIATWTPVLISQAAAQTTAPNSEVAEVFYQQIVGKWTRISKDPGPGILDTQVSIAALQCVSARKIETVSASNITGISGSLSQRLSRLIIYQKLDKGLRRVDFGERNSILFPKFKSGKIRGGRPGFEISNASGDITITFGKLKQGEYRSTVVMIENKALYLKCPEAVK